MGFNTIGAISKARSAGHDPGSSGESSKNILRYLLGTLEENRVIFIIILGAVFLQMNVSSGTALPTSWDQTQLEAPTFARQMASGCDYPCKCSTNHPRCKAGVTVKKDGCNCCYECRRQQGDLCNVKNKCDENKALYCDFQLEGGLQGICRAKLGMPCEVDDISYKDGEAFTMNCSQQCTCQDGQVACTSKCPWEDRRPSTVYCKNPVLVKITGQCCREWVCPDIHSLPEEPDLDHSVISDVVPPKRTCKHESTDWSACSETCDMGVSLRLTNENPECEDVQERRLCFVRPCGQHDAQFENEGCKRTWKLDRDVRLIYGECQSVELYKPKYCSTCKKDKCCGPVKTKTKEIKFSCPEGKIITERYMWIRSCECYDSHWCPFN